MAEATSDTRAEQPTHRYDLYVVHAAADVEWVEGFLLPALGLPPDRVITADSFRLGAAVVGELERSVAESRCTVVVLTPAFLADSWAAAGEQLATHAGLAAERPSVVPLLLEPCEVPLRLEARVRLDCTDRTSWEAELGRLRALLEAPEPSADDVACPYPGMRPFSPADAERFHGREDEVRDLAGRLRHLGLVAVIGPSGSGKSSLVLAGVLPEVARRHADQLPVRTLRPGADPVGALAAAIGAGDPVAAVDAVLAANPSAIRLVLVVDQLEEAFTLAPPPARVAFLAGLEALRRSGRAVVVATLRADFFGELMASGLWPLDAAERCEVPPLHGAALARAIVAPAAAVGVRVEPAVVERLVADAADEPGALPLVQETLVLLWASRRRRLLTLDAYEALGGGATSGLAAALATSADGAMAALPPAEREVARRIFLGLVQLGEGRRDTRRQRPVEELRAAGDDPAQFERVLAHLVARRLVTTGGAEGAARTADLAHEALIRAWPRLQAWIDESREWLRVQREVDGDARAWEDADRDEGSVYRGARLATAAGWADAHPADLTTLQKAFVDAGRQAQVDEVAEARRRAEVEAARSRRLRIALVGVVALMLVAAGLGVQARRSGDEARAQNRLARSRQLAAQAITEQSGRPDRALLLAAEAMAARPSPEARDALLWTLSSPPVASYLRTDGPAVRAVAADPAGTLVATGDARREVRLWDLEDGRSTRLGTHEDQVGSLAFSPDGSLLASAASLGAVKLWAVPSGREDGRALATDGVAGLAFLDGGRLLAAAGSGGMEVWDVGSRSRVAGPFPGARYAAAASADGRQFAAVGRGGVLLWDVTTRTARTSDLLSGPGELTPDADALAHSVRMDLAFAPEGGHLAVAVDDVITVVDPGTGRLITRILGHGVVEDMVMLADGVVAAAYPSGDVVLWDALTGEEQDRFELGTESAVQALAVVDDGAALVVGGRSLAHLDVARTRGLAAVVDEPSATGGEAPRPPGGRVALSPDGRRVAVARIDEPLVVAWVGGEAEPVTLAGSEGGRSVAFTADGATVLVLAGDGTVRRWNPTSGRRLADGAAFGETGPVAELSSDGRFAVTGGGAGPRPAAVWDVATGRRLGRPAGNEGPAGAAFSPDGRRLAVATADRVVMWDTATRRPVGGPLHATTLPDPAAGLPSPLVGSGTSLPTAHLAFSADGASLAVGTGAGDVFLYDLERGRIRHVGRGALDRGVALSPDGRQLVWVTDDGMRLWDVDAGQAIGPLLWDGATPLSLGPFDAAGALVPVIDGFGGVTGWSLDPQVWLVKACEVANRNLSQDEWERHVGGPYRRTCGDHPSGVGAPKDAPVTRYPA